MTLTLSATDDSGTVTQMRISNDGVFDTEPGGLCHKQELDASSGDGTKTVYVRFRSSRAMSLIP